MLMPVQRPHAHEWSPDRLQVAIQRADYVTPDGLASRAYLAVLPAATCLWIEPHQKRVAAELDRFGT